MNKDFQLRPANHTERGATLAEYGLVVALFALVMVGAAELLAQNAGDLLNDTGSEVAADRPTRDVVANLPVTPPAGFTPPTTPLALLTYVEKPIQLSDGSCLSINATVPASTACGDPNQALATGLSEDGVALTVEVVPGQCLVGNATAVPPTVTVGACTSADAVWQQNSISGTTVVYSHTASGQCLTAAPAPAVLTLLPCDGRPEQNLNVQY